MFVLFEIPYKTKKKAALQVYKMVSFVVVFQQAPFTNNHLKDKNEKGMDYFILLVRANAD